MSITHYHTLFIMNSTNNYKLEVAMAAYRQLKHTILNQYWGQVITFIVAISVAFALFLSVFAYLGQ